MTVLHEVIYDVKIPDSEIKQIYHAKDVYCGSCMNAIADGTEVGV